MKSLGSPEKQLVDVTKGFDPYACPSATILYLHLHA
jgi:hypothetical protein